MPVRVAVPATGNYDCPYCKAKHAEPPHPGDYEHCPLWYDWCNCACAAYYAGLRCACGSYTMAEIDSAHDGEASPSLTAHSLKGCKEA